MRRVRIADCQPGMILAAPVVNERGLLVARQGVTLTESLLQRLEELQVWHLFVEDERFRGLAVQEPLRPQTFYRLKGYLRRLITAVQAGEVASTFISVRELMEWVDTVDEEIAGVRDSFLLYPPEGLPEDQWMAHAINAAVLSALTLRRIGGTLQARQLIAAAFLQDLGLWRLSAGQREAFWERRDPEAVSEKVRQSQRIVAPLRSLSSIVKGIVAQHHERLDGSGVPEGRRGDDIHPLARVMGVADDYLSLIDHPSTPVLPHEALERLMAGVGFEYDHAAVKAFSAVAPVYPVGLEVVLRSGEGAVVVKESAVAGRPVLRILTDPEGRVVEPYEVDLSQATTKMIAKIK